MRLLAYWMCLQTPQVNCLENVCRSNNRAVLVRLLKHCELYQSLTQEYFFTALCLCCRLPDIDVSLIAELIQAGADPNYVFPGLQTTPLLDAINTGKPAIVQELLSANALVYDGNSSEPLMLATFTSQPNAAIIKMIADAGTDLIPTSLLTVRPSSSSHSLSLSLVRLTHFSLSIDCTSVIDRVKETRSQAISRSSMVLDRKGCQHRAAQGSRESSR